MDWSMRRMMLQSAQAKSWWSNRVVATIPVAQRQIHQVLGAQELECSPHSTAGQGACLSEPFPDVDWRASMLPQFLAHMQVSCAISPPAVDFALRSGDGHAHLSQVARGARSIG